ncbi:MAG: DUF2914 domain-containing protein [Natronospirillum sp.]|uniref:DUF5924 family protein n=1 Tax=Natronospirillum sp. TaxID=2812955 RepID=UPI0025E4967D|nr:DUF5924 family protein [Natronospirillum sp.]MCH8550620.1 DUF2914 domain-containing protein [Natronospirillum sp.]
MGNMKSGWLYGPVQAMRGLVSLIIRLLRRHSGFMALLGFTAGLLSFILVQRQADASRIIAILMLLTWVWLLLEKPIRHLLVVRLGFKLSPYALKFATQMVHQESLFFALPFFFITTTWADPQMLFTLLLMTAAGVSIIDPIYHRKIASNRWLFPLFHGFSIFALLLTALPIVLNLPTSDSFLLALIIAGLVSTPSITRMIQSRRWWAWPGRLILLGTLGAWGWLLQPWVPPATLWVTDMTFTHQITPEREPEDRLFNVSATAMRADGLYAFTAVRAPLGLQETIYHEWRYDGEVIDVIALQISGGREAGYRSWSRKQHFPEPLKGRWDIRVVTEGGQLIGRRTFVAGP